MPQWVLIICLLVLLTLHVPQPCHAYAPWQPARSFASAAAVAKGSTTRLQAIGPRKEMFFDIVRSGLEDRFEKDDIARVYKFCDYSTGIISPPKGNTFGHEPCEEFIDDLTAQAWWDKSRFDWVEKVESAAGIIAAELQEVMQQDELFKGDSNYMKLMGEGWTAFRLQRMGAWIDDNARRFPKTTEIIQSCNIPLAVRGVMFAKQVPGSGVQPHSDGRNFILTAHLGLMVPEKDCWISVAEEKKSWEKDKLIVFDTSFTHSTMNDSEEDRHVLIIDFWHPETTLEEQQALEFIYDTRNKFEAGRFSDIDCSYIRDGKPTNVNEYENAKKKASKTFFGLF